jgi:hypothetical protein
MSPNGYAIVMHPSGEFVSPNGYAIVMHPSGEFELRYYQDVTSGLWAVITMSYSYDDIMRAFLRHREYIGGMGKEYWIS